MVKQIDLVAVVLWTTLGSLISTLGMSSQSASVAQFCKVITL